jgi:hexosaminidase
VTSELVAAILVVLLATRLSAATDSRPCLVPWPRKMAIQAGVFTPSKSLSIGIVGENGAAQRVAETSADDLREIGFSPTLTDKSPDISLRLSAEKALGAEGYRLRVDKTIQISAATEAGLFHGTRTVLQLLAKGPGQPVQRLTIFDKPLLPMRGAMVDVARQFHSIGFHRQLVKRLASYKLNTYHIHFSDDQSYTLPSEKYPNLPTPGRHYTKEELMDLVKLAARYHVMIIPEIDMPGHTSAIVRGIPDVVCRNEGAGPCAGSDRSFNIFRDLISETMSIFPAPYFHIGGDEVDLGMWSNCPDCTARKVSESLKNNEELYNWFINRMNRYVRSQGRRAIVWTGFKLKTVPRIDKNVLVDHWQGNDADPRQLVSAGYDLINSSNIPLYVVREGWFSTPQAIAGWNVWQFEPVNPNDPSDIPTIAPSKKLLGVSFSSWENAEESQESICFGAGKQVPGYAPPAPRVQIMAERGWTGDTTSAEDLLMRVGVTPK